MVEIGLGLFVAAVVARMLFRLRLAHVRSTRGWDAARDYRLHTAEGRLMRWLPFALMLAGLAVLLLAGR